MYTIAMSRSSYEFSNHCSARSGSELVMTALDVEDGHIAGDRAWAEQILDEFDHQPATCSNCGGETFARTCQQMMDDSP